AFGDWSFKEIAREIYKNDLCTMRRFNIKDLPQLDPPIGEEEIEYFVKQLKDKALIFKNCVNTNGATVHEYISIFITIAVKHIQKHKDPTTTLSYGNLDYEIDINDVLVLVIEAKNLDIEKCS
ncbi:41548_t:CDS:2, partial [Gigaspora margarita]